MHTDIPVDGHYLGHFANSLSDRNLRYISLWLLPTALPNLKRLPKSWLIPVGATCAMAFVLDAYLGGRARDRGQSALQHRRAGAQPVVSGTAVADFQLDCLTLLPVPVPAACSREAREC